MQSKGVGKFHSKQFKCNKPLDLLTVDVLNGFYCITNIIFITELLEICILLTVRSFSFMWYAHFESFLWLKQVKKQM